MNEEGNYFKLPPNVFVYIQSYYPIVNEIISMMMRLIAAFLADDSEITRYKTIERKDRR